MDTSELRRSIRKLSKVGGQIVMSRRIFYYLSVALIIFFESTTIQLNVTFAQRNLVQCGSIVEGEFTKQKELHTYTIRLEVGDQLVAYAEPTGDTLNLSMALYNPVGDALAGSSTSPGKYYIGSSASWAGLSNRPTVKTETLSARGDYVLRIANAQFWIDTSGLTSEKVGGIGQYNIFIGCTLHDGNVVNPGDLAQSTSVPNTGGSIVDPPTFSGNGFPGLAAIDLSQSDSSRIPRTGVVEDEITPDTTNPSVFTFEATDGQQFDLTFTKLSGNLNLGLVIIDDTNKTYFVTSLIAATEVNSKLTLPAGKYRIAVFKLDLVPPTSPKITVFSIALQ